MTLSMAPGRMWINTSDPTVNDDSQNGYEIGNWWLNSTTDQLFQCLDDTNTAAVWALKPTQTAGSFAPTLEFGGASTGITYTSQSGIWVKNETQVSFNLFLALSDKGSANGNARVIGLPFPNGTIPAGFIFYPLNIGLPLTYSGFGARLSASSDEIVLFADGVLLGLQNLTDAEFQNNSQLFISGSYYV